MIVEVRQGVLHLPRKDGSIHVTHHLIHHYITRVWCRSGHARASVPDAGFAAQPSHWPVDGRLMAAKQLLVGLPSPTCMN